MPRATPSLSCRELLPVCCAESYSRAVVPRATPELLCREILPVYRVDTCANNALDEFTIYQSNACSEVPKQTHKTKSEEAELSKVVLCSEAPLLDLSEAGGEQLQATSI